MVSFTIRITQGVRENVNVFRITKSPTGKEYKLKWRTMD